VRKLLTFAAAGLAACAGAPQPEPDDSPANPTAVLETRVSSSGIGGAFPFETTQKRYVRQNMRRDESRTQGTGTFTGLFVTAWTGEGDTTIARLDRKLLWTLNHGKKEYTECPLRGCPPAAAVKPEERTAEEVKKPDCMMRLTKSSFDVKPTGQKRNINGFDTTQHEVAWLVTLQDQAKRTTTSTLSIDVWTSPVTAEMRQAINVEQAFDRAYYASAPRAKPAAAADRSKGQLLPPEVSRMMLGYLSSLSPADRAALIRASRQLESIKGQPISTRIDWSLDGNACAPKEGARDASKPILSFTIEVKSLKVEPVRDSVFTVPPGYKLASQP
jgi:hypothetical protein